MRKLAVLALTLIATLAAASAAASPKASPGRLCVGSGPGCYPTIQAAVDAAHDGDTVAIEPGTFAGGVTIDVSIRLVGAGAGRTIISGGGPVLTIGEFGASDEPTVSIVGVTITGGVTRSSPESTPFTGQEGVFAAGGGVEIPPNADFTGGAKVTIVNSVISGNRVAPTDTVPGDADCPGGDKCPFAFAGGGGIDSWGTLTLANTRVSDNRVGSASGLSAPTTSDANGGAITSFLGPLTISGSTIDHNEASATGPNGRFAEGGAIAATGGSVTVSESSVSGNTALLEASLPNSVDQLANGGGVHIGGDVSKVTITGTTISGNSISMTNSVGDAEAFAGGILVDLGIDFSMSSSIVSGNSVSSRTLAGSTGDAEGDSGAGALLGTISNTRFTANSVRATSAAGDAAAFAGALIDFGSITNSVLGDNHVHASSPNGTVFAAGGAIVVDEPGLTLRNSEVSGNTVDANAASGGVQGGGIFDGPIDDGPPGGPLTLLNSAVTANLLSGGPGVSLQGGGLYLQGEALTLRHSVMAHNVPNDCFGC
jgi:hypothetical protein